MRGIRRVRGLQALTLAVPTLLAPSAVIAAPDAAPTQQTAPPPAQSSASTTPAPATSATPAAEQPATQSPAQPAPPASATPDQIAAPAPAQPMPATPGQSAPATPPESAATTPAQPVAAPPTQSPINAPAQQGPTPLAQQGTAAAAQTTSESVLNSDQYNPFDPTRAPIIRLRIFAPILAVPQQTNGSTTVTATQIANNPAIQNFTQAIAATVPGTASAAQGEIHIRGSHGQYSYYLDGAPLPADVTGSFSDLINPKDIEVLKVYTGGFPAEYGGQLAAIFDVTAKSGKTGEPGGYIQQLVQSYQTYTTSAQIGGSSKDLSYFLSGIRESTGSFISPVDESPLHDGGNQTVGFGKLDYQSGGNDRISLDFGVNHAHLDIPNTQTQQQIGVADDQYEDGYFDNLIWKHTHNSATSRLVYYSHQSSLKYNGSEADLLSTPGGSPLDVNSIGLAETNLDQKALYNGLRFDQTTPVFKHNVAQFGFDVDYVKVNENFNILSVVDTANANAANPVPGYATASELGNVYGSDQSIYLQDDYTPGRFHANYGVRYDVHKADITTSQVSPRVNLYYTAGRNDSFRAFYDRLFQPAAFEDVKNLTTNQITTQQAAPFQPERDDFYQGGWTHKLGTSSLGFDAYYRDEIDTIDDDVIGSSQIDVPVNFTKGYARGLEATLEGAINKQYSYYANYARSWAKEAGPITGGLDFDTTTPGYIYDDHDQTDTAAFGIDYARGGVYGNIDGDFGSGFPYFQNANLTSLSWTHPHLTIDTALGVTSHRSQLALNIDNIFNHAYVIKQADPFTNIQWSLGRQYGVKYTLSF